MSDVIERGSPEWQERMDAYLAGMVEKIKTYGWALQGVFPTTESEGPGFVYTVGVALSGLDGAPNDPELIVFGLPMEVAGSILNELVARHRDGTRILAAGRRYDDIVAGFDVTFVEVSPEQVDAHLTMANNLVASALDQPRVRALQLVWPDPGGAFPWEASWDTEYDKMQPVLGEPPTGRETR